MIEEVKILKITCDRCGALINAPKVNDDEYESMTAFHQRIHTISGNDDNATTYWRATAGFSKHNLSYTNSHLCPKCQRAIYEKAIAFLDAKYPDNIPDVEALSKRIQSANSAINFSLTREDEKFGDAETLEMIATIRQAWNDVKEYNNRLSEIKLKKIGKIAFEPREYIKGNRSIGTYAFGKEPETFQIYANTSFDEFRKMFLASLNEDKKIEDFLTSLNEDVEENTAAQTQSLSPEAKQSAEVTEALIRQAWRDMREYFNAKHDISAASDLIFGFAPKEYVKGNHNFDMYKLKGLNTFSVTPEVRFDEFRRLFLTYLKTK